MKEVIGYHAVSSKVEIQQWNRLIEKLSARGDSFTKWLHEQIDMELQAKEEEGK